MKKTLNDIAKHLEYLGYKTHKNKPKKPGELYTISLDHASKAKFVVLELAANYVLFRANFTTEKTPTIEMDKFINYVNSKFVVSKVFYDVENAMAIVRFQALHIGPYEKQSFGFFWDSVQTELQQLWNLDAQYKVFTN